MVLSRIALVRNIWLRVAVLLCAAALPVGCSQKADPRRPLEKVRQEAASMNAAQLELRARAYVDEIEKQRAEIQKIQEKIRKMPLDKVFDNNFLQNDIKKIGRKAEALFERYLIYVNALKEKGGDLDKVRLKTAQE
jgi:TolA-binding protein